MEFKRANIKVNGIVQGVGFRPFIHKLVLEDGLAGWIRNTTSGAEIEVEGSKEAIEGFINDIEEKAPLLAVIENIETEFFDNLNMYNGFRIEDSDERGKRRALVSPDVAICQDCLKELNDKNDRRYRYPFINCTNCGPRFTIIKDIPYDRKNTTMSEFPMCSECASEYGNIENRRYHAQPDCCPKCGPQLEFLDGDGNPVTRKAPRVLKVDVTDNANIVLETRGGGPIEQAIEALAAGNIVAVKGLGGFHLAARADSPEIAATLRQRKQRDEKPFAIMCRDAETARKYAVVSVDEQRALESFRRPIVLLRKKNREDFKALSENNYIGIMLPYTPVHYMLLGGELDSLIMTSANLSDLPIMYRNEEAIEQLKGIADYFLINNRDIETRCDDSLQWIVDGREYPVRRSRGYVPQPLTMEGADSILACGAEQKASFALAKEDYVFPSQHIGDLKNIETYANYQQQIIHFERLFDVQVKTIACDLHPDFMSTDYAASRAQLNELNLIRVQHHHAHMASCMADNHIDGRCIGIIWDGTGLGTDGTVWGGEFLVGDYSGYKRWGHIAPVRLPGGDAAAKEIWRSGISLMQDSGLSSAEVFPGEKENRVRQMLGSDINCPKSSGMGRLFDGAAAMLGLKYEASYEGQGAVLLEAAAGDSEGLYPFDIVYRKNSWYRDKDVSEQLSPEDETIVGRMDKVGEENIAGRHVIETGGIIRAMYADIQNGRAPELIAADFMNTLVQAAADMCSRIRLEEGLSRVVLSGGTFQNLYMLERLTDKLEKKGFTVCRHSRVSCNDEGISFGQCAVAAARVRN